MAKNKNKNKSIQKPLPNGNGGINAESQPTVQADMENDDLQLNQDISDTKSQNIEETKIEESKEMGQGTEVSNETGKLEKAGPSFLCKIGYVIIPI